MTGIGIAVEKCRATIMPNSDACPTGDADMDEVIGPAGGTKAVG